MPTLAWIIISGILMSAIALVGVVTLTLAETTLERILLPLVAFSAGTLVGGALFHLLPESVHALDNDFALYLCVAGGFLLFFVMEQMFSWHHCHRPLSQHKHPVTYLMLISDSVHNFIDGVAVAASFLMDVRLGITTWLVVAAHEVPQELGDFGVMVHGGWSKRNALLFNLFSGLTFLLGGLSAYFAATAIRLELLVPFAAGAFLYIGAADLIPEIKAGGSRRGILVHTLSFLAGLLGMLVLKGVMPEH